MVFTPGKSGNPAGRKPGQTSTITGALRRLADPDAIASFLVTTALDARAPLRERVRCAELIYDRLEGRSVARSVSMRVGADSVLPVGFFELAPDARERVIADIRKRALDGATPELLSDGEPHDEDQ